MFTPTPRSVLRALSLSIIACLVGLALWSARGRAATNIVVNSTSDAAADDGLCTLREAITAAHTDAASGAAAGECAAGSGADTISFNINGALTGHDAMPSCSTSNGTTTCTLVVTYALDENYTGADSFTFSVTDTAMASGSATVNVTVLPDADGDGVADDDDACPDTPPNTDVNAAGCAADACFAPPADMIAWYAAGGNANDARGPTLENGSLQGGALSSAAGKVGQAFSFNGTSGRIDVPHSDALNPSALTVDAWVNPTNTAGDRSILFKGNQQYVLKLRDGKVVFGSKDAAGNYTEFEGGTTVATNAWTHVAATHDGQTRRIYVNGVLDAAPSPQAGLFAGDTTTMRIGRHALTATEFYSGRIDEVQIFGRALAAAEINAIYLADTRGKCRPAAPSAPDLQDSSDTGTNNDNITSDTTPAFEIDGVTPGATVELLRNGLVVTGEEAEGTSISLGDPGTPPGTHIYAARQVIANIYSQQSPSLSVRIDTSPPSVGFIGRNSPNPTAPGSTVEFSVIFTDSVTGVDAADFFLTTTGTVSGAMVTGVSGAGATYTVTVHTGTGSGTVRLDLIDDDTIMDGAGNPLGGPGAANGNSIGPAYDIPPGLSVSDVTRAEGNAGETTFTFNVVLDLPAGPGGVTFEVSTADGATDPANAGSDYVGFAGQDGFIAEGQTMTTVAVTVNGDTTREEDETFTVSVSDVVGASVADPQGLGTILNDDGAPSTGQVIISEFRLRGPIPAGTPTPGNEQGQLDEFIELYNNTDEEIVVADPAPTGSANGWAIVSSDDPSTPKFIIPAGTTIPARGHFLVTNSQGYSLSPYATADVVADSPTNNVPASYIADIPDGAGLALYRTANPTAAGTEDRLDSVGFAPAAPAPGAPSLASPALVFSEGTPLQPAGGVTASAEHSFLRRLTSGRPQDTEDNAADFVFVSTDAGLYDGAQSVLGAPGPQNSGSPIQRNQLLKASLIDPQVSHASPPNTVRKADCPTSDPPTETTAEECVPGRSSQGTFSIRRRFTNRTLSDVTHLRFRVVDVTTLNSPGYTPGGTQADLRPISSLDVHNVEVTGGTITVRGTTLEEPPDQSANGGGLNSSLVVALPDPLVPNESISVQLLLGVQQGGAYRFFVNVEAVSDDNTFAPARPRSGATQAKPGKPTTKP